MPADWTRDEAELIVADYFAMLEAELSGRPVNKAERNRSLQRQIGRSKGSIEFKHANISAVLVQPQSPAATDFSRLDDLVDAPPEPIGEPGVHLAAPPRSPRPVRKIDFVRLDAENRRLGRMGEEWTLEFEERRLTDGARRPDLAKRIVWVSNAEGDGAGYDIRSFNDDGTPRLIEVKTTGLGKYHAFSVSPNEVSVSERAADRYHLYRLFRFGTGPRLYVLQGALSHVCRLEPSQFSARVAR